MNMLTELDNLPFVAVCFYIFTAILTLLVLLWSCFKKSEALTTFNKRMATLWVLILLFTAALSFGKLPICILCIIFSIIGLAEYEKLTSPQQQFSFSYPLLYGLIIAQYAAIYFGSTAVFLALIPLSVFILVPYNGIVHPNQSDIWPTCLKDHAGLLLTVYAMSYMAAFPAILDHADLLVFVLILTLMSDFFQAICGFLCGRHHIVPTVSPHKTWEGLIGGGILSAGLACIMGKYLTPYTISELAVLGFVLNVCAFCGDVTISAIKRHAGVKDSSNLLPGHGGFLDRFDSILLTAPILFWHTILYGN